MKAWWKDFIQDYLTFSAKDRRAVIILMLLIGIVLVLPYFFGKPKKLKPEQVAVFKEKAAAIQQQKESSSYTKRYGQDEESGFQPYQPSQQYANNANATLFEFDPNTLDEKGWKQLGVRDKTIATIQKFLAKGYRFRKPEDLGKIYGLRKADAERLMPYVVINNPNKTAVPEAKTTATANYATEKKAYNPPSIDINRSDTTEWIALPGIGSKLAARIVNYRDKLGGFYTVSQVAETYGLADSTFQKIKPRLVISATDIRKININSATAAQIKHPYIPWHIANAIVQYRQQHGSFKTITDLKKIMVIDDALLQKITPYLHFD